MVNFIHIIYNLRVPNCTFHITYLHSINALTNSESPYTKQKYVEHSKFAFIRH